LFCGGLGAVVFGLVAGSFLNVVIYRLPRGESIIRPPSSCPECGARLAWFELVPVLSYLFLRGRCRRCGGRISLRYPAVEALTAGLFLTVYLMYETQLRGGLFPPAAHFGWTLAKGVFLTGGLIAAAFIDAEHRIIPNRLVLALFGGAVVLVPLAGDIGLGSAVLGGLAAGGLLLLLALLSKGGMGGGDIKFAAVCGLYLGWPAVMIGLFLGALCGSLFGLALVLTKRRRRREPIPFGPHLAAGFFVALLWGEELLRWYKGLAGM